MEHTLTIENFSIHYDSHRTEHCPIAVTDQLYIEDKPLPQYFVGNATMSAAAFYQADCPEFTGGDYQLSKSFQQILLRFPHTNQKQIQYSEKEGYLFRNVPIYIEANDYLIGKLLSDSAKKMSSILDTIEQLTPVYAEELADLDSYKRKRLFSDGHFGSRKLLAPEHSRKAKSIQEKLHYNNELYSFAHYSYAAMIEFLPEYGVMTYEQFHEAYGKYIYSFTITRNEQTIPLLWPDYLYHQPENHLEFGVLSLADFKRYTLFNDWQSGDEVVIELLADGFEDVRFKTILKQKLPTPPKLTPASCRSKDILTVTVSEDILQEIQRQEARIEILDPKKNSMSQKQLTYHIKTESLTFPCDQFEQFGRYQLKITSNRYGQLLLLFAVTKEENK